MCQFSTIKTGQYIIIGLLDKIQAGKKILHKRGDNLFIMNDPIKAIPKIPKWLETICKSSLY